MKALVVGDRLLADAGVVDRDRVAAGSAKNLVDGLIRDLPQNVPERHLDGCQGAQLTAGRAEDAHRLIDASPEVVNPARVGAEEELPGVFVEDLFRRLGVMA